jgi:hypothetical protein
MILHFDQIIIKDNNDQTFTLIFKTEQGLLNQEYDNVDTLWRFVGGLLKDK